MRLVTFRRARRDRGRKRPSLTGRTLRGKLLRGAIAAGALGGAAVAVRKRGRKSSVSAGPTEIKLTSAEKRRANSQRVRQRKAEISSEIASSPFDKTSGKLRKPSSDWENKLQRLTDQADQKYNVKYAVKRLREKKKGRFSQGSTLATFRRNRKRSRSNRKALITAGAGLAGAGLGVLAANRIYRSTIKGIKSSQTGIIKQRYASEMQRMGKVAERLGRASSPGLHPLNRKMAQMMGRASGRVYRAESRNLRQAFNDKNKSTRQMLRTGLGATGLGVGFRVASSMTNSGRKRRNRRRRR